MKAIRSVPLKFAALLTVIKWKTVLLTMLAQYIAFLFAFNNQSNIWHSLGEGKVHLIILATALFLAGGGIINNFYDAERDLVNRPIKTRFLHLVSKGFTLRLYFLLNTLGTIVAFAASWRIGLFFVFYGLALWFYSHKLSRFMFIRELAASLLAVMAFFSLLLYFKMVTFGFLIYGFSIFLVLFTRELYKDIRSIKGDIIYGYKSIATSIGVVPSVRLFQALIAMSILPDALVIWWIDKLPLQVIMTFIIVIKASALTVISHDVVKRTFWISWMLKLIIAVYILGLAWL